MENFMNIVEAMIIKDTETALRNIDKLTNAMEVTLSANPIEIARVALRNRPIMIMLIKQRMLLTTLKGI